MSIHTLPFIVREHHRQATFLVFLDAIGVPLHARAGAKHALVMTVDSLGLHTSLSSLLHVGLSNRVEVEGHFVRCL